MANAGKSVLDVVRNFWLRTLQEGRDYHEQLLGERFADAEANYKKA
jgi:hypothetical protein